MDWRLQNIWDAVSEGDEGKYYTFTFDEIMDVLGKERGGRISDTFDITSDGNFEGVNIPNLLGSNELEHDFDGKIDKLYSYRKNRRRLYHSTLDRRYLEIAGSIRCSMTAQPIMSVGITLVLHR